MQITPPVTPSPAEDRVKLGRGTRLGAIEFTSQKGETDAAFAYSDGAFVSAVSFDDALAMARDLSSGTQPAQGIVDVGRGAYLVTGLIGNSTDYWSNPTTYPHSLDSFTTGTFRKVRWDVSAVESTHKALRAVVDGDLFADLRKDHITKPVALPAPPA